MAQIPMLLQDPEAWIALATLIAMEVVLGIDNLVFLALITNRLPEHQQARARRIGLGLAVVMRLALLSLIAVIVRLTEPVIALFGHAFSWRDMILIAGGLFLLWKATTEIHDSVTPEQDGSGTGQAVARIGFTAAVGQILVLDLVFSVDSIITAVGMTPHIPIMVVAVVVAVIAMLVAADPLAQFVKAHPTVLMLALGFLFMIGMTLLADGFGVHVPKGYIYAAMAFSAGVEALNILRRRNRQRRPIGEP